MVLFWERIFRFLKQEPARSHAKETSWGIRLVDLLCIIFLIRLVCVHLCVCVYLSSILSTSLRDGALSTHSLPEEPWVEQLFKPRSLWLPNLQSVTNTWWFDFHFSTLQWCKSNPQPYVLNFLYSVNYMRYLTLYHRIGFVVDDFAQL